MNGLKIYTFFLVLGALISSLILVFKICPLITPHLEAQASNLTPLVKSEFQRWLELSDWGEALCKAYSQYLYHDLLRIDKILMVGYQNLENVIKEDDAGMQQTLTRTAQTNFLRAKEELEKLTPPQGLEELQQKKNHFY